MVRKQRRLCGSPCASASSFNVEGEENGKICSQQQFSVKIARVESSGEVSRLLLSQVGGNHVSVSLLSPVGRQVSP